MRKSSRRTFVKEAGGVVAAACCGLAFSTLINACSSVKYVKAQGNRNKLSLDKSELQDVNYVVVTNDALAVSIYLSKQGDGYTALEMICTHKQCGLRPTGNFLFCPCHGSEFSNTGKVLKSPATENLKRYPVNVTNEKLEIIIQ